MHPRFLTPIGGVKLAITPPPSSPLMAVRVDSSGSLTDGFVGVRYLTPLGERWSLTLRGDAGAGDTELTWNASAVLGYHFGQNDRFNILVGYRHMEIELKDTVDSTRVDTDLTMSGPEVGFGFRF